MKNYILLSSLFLILSCEQSYDVSEEVIRTKVISEITETNVTDTNSTNNLIIETINKNEYSTKTIFTLEHGWGYQILNHGKLYINQPHIPSVQGNHGFKTEENASTTASFIIHKLNNNIFPPTISKEELDSLGVL